MSTFLAKSKYIFNVYIVVYKKFYNLLKICGYNFVKGRTDKMSYLSKKYLNEIKTKRSAFFENFQVFDSYQSIEKGEKFDIFLSYSYPDKDFALIIFKLLRECGYKTYIDLKDKYLDRNDVDEETARRISKIMNNCKCLVYVHTPSAKVSKWCPWELGYMSGRTNFRCCVVPLIEDKEDFPHQEYLGLYPIVEYEKIKDTDEYAFWVRKYKTSSYVNLKFFIDGKDPYVH